jgi:hypothetical protein
MAVDRKSQHVGNHGGKYMDNDGMSKQFTYIDHDKKTKISKLNSSEQEMERIKQELKDYRVDLQERILKIPASLAPDIYYDFTVRGANLTEITWNEKMIKDEGLDLDRLRTLAVILENTIELHRIIL